MFINIFMIIFINVYKYMIIFYKYVYKYIYNYNYMYICIISIDGGKDFILSPSSLFLSFKPNKLLC